MNRKAVYAALAVGVSAVAAPMPAKALGFCSTGSLQACASITATYGTGSLSNHLYIRAWNLFGASGVSHVMTFVGIGSAGWSGTATWVAARFNGNPITTWTRANTTGQGGVPNNNPVGGQMDLGGITSGVNYGLVGCGGGSKPTQYATCLSGPYLELEFVTTTQMDLSKAVFGLHSQDINNGGADCSLWVASDGTLVSQTGSCTSVVPEPISMILLGSGLAGVGGIGAFRRRKKDDEIA